MRHLKSTYLLIMASDLSGWSLHQVYKYLITTILYINCSLKMNFLKTNFPNKTQRGVALFYILVNLFNVWFHKAAGFSYLLLHSICCNTTLHIAYGKLRSIHTKEQSESRSITSQYYCQKSFNLMDPWKCPMYAEQCLSVDKFLINVNSLFLHS